MRVPSISLGLTLILAHATLCMAAPGQITIDIWPGKAPGGGATVGEEKVTRETRPDGKTVITGITNVSKPTLAVFRPAAMANMSAAVVIFPGGGYTWLAWDHEGEQVARWLNSIGVTAAVLKYRVPRQQGAKDRPPVQAAKDAQRAISLMRSKAAEWGIDAKRIGVMGFSAGGHLAAWATTNFDKRVYDKIDAADDVSCRPDFAVLIYPAGLIKRGPTELSPEIRVTPQTPPCFFIHASDDFGNSPESSVGMYLALQHAKVSAELHIYASGGHGFGMNATGKPTATWPKRCEDWLRDIGVVPASTAP